MLYWWPKAQLGQMSLYFTMEKLLTEMLGAPRKEHTTSCVYTEAPTILSSRGSRMVGGLQSPQILFAPYCALKKKKKLLPTFTGRKM